MPRRILLSVVGPLAISLCMDGCHGPDSSSLSLLPELVSFRVNPTVLVAGGGAATLTWSVVQAESVTIDNGVGNRPAAGSAQVQVDKTTSFQMTATNSHGSQTWLTKVTVPAPLAIQGKVLDSPGVPLADARVLIPGHPVLRSQPDGTFSVATVLPPYDLAVADATGATSTVYQGLTTATPTAILEVVAPHRKLAGVTLKLTGLSFPVASGSVRENLERLVLSAPEFGSVRLDLDPNTGAVQPNSTIEWDGAATLSAGARIEVWSFVNAREPVGYYSRNMVTLTDGQVANISANMGQVGAGSQFFDFYFNANSPAGYGTAEVDAREYFSSSEIYVSIPGSQFAAGYAGRIWGVPGAGAGGIARAVSDGGEETWSGTLGFPSGELDTEAPPKQVNLVPAVVLAGPADASNPSAPLNFGWTDAAGSGAYRLQLSQPGKHLTVFTTSSSLTLPDLSPIQFELSSGVTSTWKVWRYGGGLATPDALAVPAAAYLDVWADGTARSHSVQRSFISP